MMGINLKPLSFTDFIRGLRWSIILNSHIYQRKILNKLIMSIVSFMLNPFFGFTLLSIYVLYGVAIGYKEFFY